MLLCSCCCTADCTCSLASAGIPCSMHENPFLSAVQPQLFREHAGIVLAVSAGVTVARITLQRAWRPFQEASQAANDQASQFCW